MLFGALARMVRKSTRVAKGVELRIVSYQLANGGSRVGGLPAEKLFRKQLCDLSPRPGIAAEREERHQRKRQTTHFDLSHWPIFHLLLAFEI